LNNSCFEGIDLFNGWIQEARVFLAALVNIEIMELYDKTNAKILIQKECRCPNDFPRNENTESKFCLRNVKNSPEREYRLNEHSHSIDFLNDNDFQSSWISCILTIDKPISIVIDLANGIYLLERIEIYFSSIPPTNILLERFSNHQWFFIQSYSIDCNANNISCSKLPEYD
jgi:hypothetical protein